MIDKNVINKIKINKIYLVENMKRLRLEDVDFEILKEVAKRKQMEPEEFVEIVIQEYFNDPKKK